MFKINFVMRSKIESVQIRQNVFAITWRYSTYHTDWTN